MSEELNLIWLEGQDCAGCTISVKQASSPTLIDVLTGAIPGLDGLKLVYHPTLMFEWGDDASKVLVDAAEGKYDPFVLILEGAIPDEAAAAPGVFCVVGEYHHGLIKLSDIVKKLADRCAVAVAIGSCASYGGIPHGIPNPTGAQGLLEYLGREWKGALGLPVICIPGCPPRPDNIIQILGQTVLAARGIAPLPALDEWHRPVDFFGHTMHELCPICGFYAEGIDAHAFGDAGCLGALGCKGIITNCNNTMWADGFGGCTGTGVPCFGCTHPDFPDAPTSPFFAKAPAMPFIMENIKGMIAHAEMGFERLKPVIESLLPQLPEFIAALDEQMEAEKDKKRKI